MGGCGSAPAKVEYISAAEHKANITRHRAEKSAACYECEKHHSHESCVQFGDCQTSSFIADLGDWIKQLRSQIVRAINDFFEDIVQNPDWYVPRLLAIVVMIFIMILIWKHFDAIKRAARGIKKRIQDFFAPPPLLPVFEQDCDPKINRVFPSTV